MTTQRLTPIEQNWHEFTLEPDMVAPDGSVYEGGIFIKEDTATVTIKQDLDAEPTDIPF
jgi:hypothetical protein